MIWLAFPAMVILVVRFAIVMINSLTRQGLKHIQGRDNQLVSVLIPARNEEKQLPVLLEGLLTQDYINTEIIVYDDDSKDDTPRIIKDFSCRDHRIKGIMGGALPEGWNGKNHACHCLSLEAKGFWFLFIDADVRVEPDLISKSVAFAKSNELTLLSIFPRQIMGTLGERITVPVMNWILLSLLPVRLVRRSHYPSLAAANGQFMLFSAREYRQHRFHEMVRDINVEDIHIMRNVKRMGYKGDTLLSGGEVSCRMYRNLPEGIYGFTRSMFAFFGGSGITLMLFTIFTTFGPLFVWLGMSWKVAGIYLAMALILRLVVAAMSKQPVYPVLVLAPLQQAAFFIMVFESFRLRFRGKNTWKDRTIDYKGI